MSSATSFNIPADTTVRWLGLWSGSTYLGYSPNAGNPKEFIADPATSIITSLAHGYVDTNKVAIYGDTMPAGLIEGKVYFVVNSTANTFQVAATSGGSPIAFTSGAASGCVVSTITEEIYAVADTHTISSWIIGLPN